jgi:hypothetical protein
MERRVNTLKGFISFTPSDPTLERGKTGKKNRALRPSEIIICCGATSAPVLGLCVVLIVWESRLGS